MNWKNLNAAQKSEWMSLCRKNGIQGLPEMRRLYDELSASGEGEGKTRKFGEGGDSKTQQDNPYQVHPSPYLNGNPTFMKPSELEELAIRMTKPAPNMTGRNWPLHYWVEPITQEDIAEGKPNLYTEQKDTRYYKDKETGRYYMITDKDSLEELNNYSVSQALDEIPYSEFRKLLPKKDYIGGTPYEVRMKYLDRNPQVKEMIQELASLYGVNPNNLMHRYLREGYVDKAIRIYNDLPVQEQKSFFEKYAENPINLYQRFGLDDIASHIMEGRAILKNGEEWESLDEVNEKGRDIQSAVANNLKSALGMMAADLAYRQGELQKRGISQEDMPTYLNASFPLGLYHKDLANRDWIMRTYGNVPQYYSKFRNGGPLDVNKFAPGGNLDNEEGYYDVIRPSIIRSTLNTNRQQLNEKLHQLMQHLQDTLRPREQFTEQEIQPQRESLSTQMQIFLENIAKEHTSEESLPASIPNRDVNYYFRRQANALERPEKKIDTKRMSKDEIRELQQSISDNGGYEKLLENKSTQEIKDIQRTLVKRGFLSARKKDDGSFAEVDGIVGKRTLEAWNKYNVDGIWGDKSQKAYNHVNNAADKRWNADFLTTGYDGCAQWVTAKYENTVGQVSKQNGIIGNAWQMPKNVENAGGKMLFNIYDHGFENVQDVPTLKRITAQRLAEEQFDVSQLQEGDIIGIYYPRSSYHQDVLDEGTTYNTHVGIVTGFDKNGIPIIEHNMMGTHHKDKANALKYGAKIATVSRPKLGQPSVQPYEFKMGKIKYDIDFTKHRAAGTTTPEKREILDTFIRSMDGASPVIQQIYPDVDMDAVEQIALSVLGRETAFLQDTESTRTGVARMKQHIEDSITRKMKSTDSISSDLTKFKLRTLTSDERDFLDIHSLEDLNDPAKAARASLIYLARQYDYVQRFAQENPELGITKEDIENLTILSYNQSIGRIGWSVDETGNKIQNKQELEIIRSLANNDEIISDILSSKYGYLAKKFQRFERTFTKLYEKGIFGTGLLAGTKNTSYINAARQNMQRINKKQKNV